MSGGWLRRGAGGGGGLGWVVGAGKGRRWSGFVF